MKGKGTSFDGGPVGYKRPPVEHQFKKGQKPPGSGRRRESKNFATLIGEQLESKVTVNENGKKSRMTVREALTKRAIAKGLTGSLSDLAKVINIIDRLSPTQTLAEQPVLIIRTMEGDDE